MAHEAVDVPDISWLADAVGDESYESLPMHIF